MQHRSDRRDIITPFWSKVCSTIKIVEAVYYKQLLPGLLQYHDNQKISAQYATMLSHRKALKAFIASWDTVGWIIEDDAVPMFGRGFLDSTFFNQLVGFPGFVNLAPNLSSIDIQLLPERIYSYNSRGKPHCLHFYQVSREMAIKLLEHITIVVQVSQRVIADIDLYSSSHIVSSCYFTGTPLAKQIQSHSDIEGRVVDYRLTQGPLWQGISSRSK